MNYNNLFWGPLFSGHCVFVFIVCYDSAANNNINAICGDCDFYVTAVWKGYSGRHPDTA